MALAKASGFGLTDLANAPGGVYLAVREMVQEEQKRSKRQAMRDKLRNRRR